MAEPAGRAPAVAVPRAKEVVLLDTSPLGRYLTARIPASASVVTTIAANGTGSGSGGESLDALLRDEPIATPLALESKVSPSDLASLIVPTAKADPSSATAVAGAWFHTPEQMAAAARADAEAAAAAAATATAGAAEDELLSLCNRCGSAIGHDRTHAPLPTNSDSGAAVMSPFDEWLAYLLPAFRITKQVSTPAVSSRVWSPIVQQLTVAAAGGVTQISFATGLVRPSPLASVLSLCLAVMCGLLLVRSTATLAIVCYAACAVCGLWNWYTIQSVTRDLNTQFLCQNAIASFADQIHAYDTCIRASLRWCRELEIVSRGYLLWASTVNSRVAGGSGDDASRYCGHIIRAAVADSLNSLQIRANLPPSAPVGLTISGLRELFRHVTTARSAMLTQLAERVRTSATPQSTVQSITTALRELNERMAFDTHRLTRLRESESSDQSIADSDSDMAVPVCCGRTASGRLTLELRQLSVRLQSAVARIALAHERLSPYSTLPAVAGSSGGGAHDHIPIPADEQHQLETDMTFIRQCVSDGMVVGAHALSLVGMLHLPAAKPAPAGTRRRRIRDPNAAPDAPAAQPAVLDAVASALKPVATQLFQGDGQLPAGDAAGDSKSPAEDEAAADDPFEMISSSRALWANSSGSVLSELKSVLQSRLPTAAVPPAAAAAAGTDSKQPPAAATPTPIPTSVDAAIRVVPTPAPQQPAATEVKASAPPPATTAAAAAVSDVSSLTALITRSHEMAAATASSSKKSLVVVPTLSVSPAATVLVSESKEPVAPAPAASKVLSMSDLLAMSNQHFQSPAAAAAAAANAAPSAAAIAADAAAANAAASAAAKANRERRRLRATHNQSVFSS